MPLTLNHGIGLIGQLLVAAVLPAGTGIGKGWVGSRASLELMEEMKVV